MLHLSELQVAETDKSRPIWPSSPASGWASGVDRLTSRPTGNKTPIVGEGFNTTRPPLGQYPFFMVREQIFCSAQCRCHIFIRFATLYWCQESHGPYGGNWLHNRGHRDYISDAVIPVAPNGAEASCLGLCQIHSNSLWGRGDVGHAGACDQICTPYATPQWTGPSHLGWFKSEFGCEVCCCVPSGIELVPDMTCLPSEFTVPLA